MRKRRTWCAVALAGCACLFVGHVVAQDEGGKEAAPAAGGMPAHLKLAEEHQTLRRMAGRWDSEWTWTAPGMPPLQGKGTATSQLLFEGRFLRQDYESTMMGQPWHGILHMGYDTIDKEFVSVWMDNMSPLMAISRGKRQADGSIRLVGIEPDPASGRKQKVVVVIRWADDDRYSVAFHTVGADGKETRVGLMTYARQ